MHICYALSYKFNMEAAPFKHPLGDAKAEAAVTPELLPTYFEEFDQIFRDTGLPPIWNGNTLVPWTVFHQESILVAKQCHEQLGIVRPQNELKGPYAKPVWTLAQRFGKGSNRL